MEVIKRSKQKARKNYRCDGRDQLISHVDGNDEAHKEPNAQIKKGEIYYKQTQVEDREIGHFISCLGCNNYIEEYRFFDFAA